MTPAWTPRSRGSRRPRPSSGAPVRDTRPAPPRAPRDGLPRRHRAARRGSGSSASVQPAFDAFWGGDRGHVCRAAGCRPRARAGRWRLRPMNPFASMMAAGMTVALRVGLAGDPLRAVGGGARACVNHHDADQRVSARSAFLAHTRGGWRAAGFDDRGYLDFGLPATFAVWEVGDLVVQAPTTGSRRGRPTRDRARPACPTCRPGRPRRPASAPSSVGGPSSTPAR